MMINSVNVLIEFCSFLLIISHIMRLGLGNRLQYFCPLNSELIQTVDYVGPKCNVCQPSLSCWEKKTLTSCPEPQQQHAQLSGSIRGNEKSSLQGRGSLCLCVFYVSVWRSFGRGFVQGCKPLGNMYVCVFMSLCVCVGVYVYTCADWLHVTLKGRKAEEWECIIIIILQGPLSSV